MARAPTITTGMQEIGVAGAYDPNQGLHYDEFLYDLRGHKAIKKYREMRENDPIIGAILTAMDMMIREVDWKVEGDDAEATEFIDQCLHDMAQPFEDFMSDVLGFLPYGFSYFEIVYKRRQGANRRSRNDRSMYDDGRIGIKKLAPRAQWTIDRFETTTSGDIMGAYQNAYQHGRGEVFIPIDKALLFRSASMSNKPSGRSVLRNAYIPYYYATHVQSLEAIAVERELNGLPLGRVPAKYLSDSATESEKAFVAAYQEILAKVRKNEVGYVMVPSDVYEGDNGAATNNRMVEFELVASKGTRDIDTGKVVQRHQQNMARSVLADFIMLGSSERGSYALSSDKTNLFLKSIVGHLTTVKAVLNKDLIPNLLAVNGFPRDAAMVNFGKVAGPALMEFGTFIEKIVGARPGLAQSDEFWAHILEQASFPAMDEIPDDPTPPPAPETGNLTEPPEEE